MLKKVKLKNFESHEDTEVEFTDGLNLLIGGSNQGKSSIIRAISLVVANRFDKEEVRNGCEFCEIELETDKGKIRAKRGESINQWSVQKTGEEPKEYKNIGLEVPPEAMEILGMGKVSHGEISEIPNIMFQLEKHYMISEIDGKKSTSNMIARMMDEAIGIGGMEELIKDMADDFQSKKKELNSCLSEISERKSGIIEESIFLSQKKSMEDLKNSLKDLMEIKVLLRDSEDLSLALKEINLNLRSVEEEINLLNSIETLWSVYSDLAMKYACLNKIIGLRASIYDLDESTKALASLEDLFSIAASKKERMLHLLSARDLKLKLESLSYKGEEKERELEDGIIDLIQRKKELDEAEERFQALTSLNRKFCNSKISCDRVCRDLQEVEEKFKHKKEELGVCPLCGNSLCEHNI